MMMGFVAEETVRKTLRLNECEVCVSRILRKVESALSGVCQRNRETSSGFQARARDHHEYLTPVDLPLLLSTPLT